MKLLRSVITLSSALRNVFESRLDLLAAEIEQEKQRLFRIFWASLFGAGAFFLAILGLFALILELTADEYKYIVYIVLTLIMALTSFVLMLWTRRLMSQASRPFAASRNALRRDKESLRFLTRHLW